jgi:ABC-type transporter Mla MlaB component
MIDFQQEHNILIFSGALLFNKAASFVLEWERIRTQHIFETLTLDCSKIVKADSSFIALLIEIRCWAHQRNIPFYLKDLPVFIKNFLTVYGIENMLMNPSLENF